MKPPFFICGPRTRSSILFETMAPWASEYYGLINLTNTEFFMETIHNMELVDSKTNTYHNLELYPIVQDNEIKIHYIWPYVFSNRKQRNLHKLKILKKLKKQDKHYNIKGTTHITATPNKIIDFFSDRHFVITRRKDMEQNALSFLYASATKLFNARSNNIERYKSILNNGIHISNETIELLPRYFEQWQKLNNLENLLITKNLDYTVVYYEEMNTKEEIYSTIDKLYKTVEWRKHLPQDIDNHVPISVEKDYKDIIKNYKDVIERIRQYL